MESRCAGWVFGYGGNVGVWTVLDSCGFFVYILENKFVNVKYLCM